MEAAGRLVHHAGPVVALAGAAQASATIVSPEAAVSVIRAGLEVTSLATAPRRSDNGANKHHKRGAWSGREKALVPVSKANKPGKLSGATVKGNARIHVTPDHRKELTGSKTEVIRAGIDREIGKTTPGSLVRIGRIMPGIFTTTTDIGATTTTAAAISGGDLVPDYS